MNSAFRPPGSQRLVATILAMTQSVITVAGMTCSHCVNAVRAEVGKIPGVERVEVDLESGTVTIDAPVPVDPQALREAIDEAGYELA